MKTNHNTTILGKLRSILPVSRKTHEAHMAKAREEQQWLLGQMKQTVRRNVALESAVAQHGLELDTHQE